MEGLGTVILLVVAATSIWVAFDAPRHGLSWTWGLGCVALWVVGFPWYLVERSKRTRPLMPPSTPTAPEGWYPDPVDAAQLERYWAGGEWTRLTRPRS